MGGIVVRADGRVLLVRRGNAPARGYWSVPGGRVEAGESDAEATVREVLEETALTVHVGDLAGTVERDAPDGSVYVINDYHCTPVDESAADLVVAGDDADEVGWFTPEEVRRLDCVPGLLESLDAWHVLDGAPAAESSP